MERKDILLLLRFSETSARIYQLTWHNITEGKYLYIYYVLVFTAITMNSVRFVVLTAVLLEFQFLWDVTLCRQVKGYLLSGGTNYQGY
jgi:hypothetical protein